MRGISELLSAAWSVFQARFGVLFAIYLLLVLLTMAPILLAFGSGMLLLQALPSAKGGVITGCALIGGIAALLGSLWGCGALLCAVLDDGLDIRSAFSSARRKILPLLWVFLLTGFVVTGGYLLFFIPGLIFSVWFLMAPFVLLDDDTRGSSALLKSRALVEGRWFDVFLRLVVMWTFSALIGAIPGVGALLLLVATPYLVLYQALIFKDLKEEAEPVAYSCSFWDKAKWPAVAAIGYIAIPAALLLVFGIPFLERLQPLMHKAGIEVPAVGAGGSQTPSGAEGEWRVIPIPGKEGGQPPATQPEAGAPGQPSAPLQGDTQREKMPEDIHVFIYAVNCPGRVLANGVELKRIEDQPDMQYNYNMSGDKLRYGKNTITVEYTPLSVSGNMLKPRIHIKISQSGAQKQVLVDWRVEETVAGQKSFDMEIPAAPGKQ